MDPLTMLAILKTLVIFSRNLLAEFKTAKADDGKISVSEIPCIVLNTLLRSVDDLGVGVTGEEILKGVKMGGGK